MNEILAAIADVFSWTFPAPNSAVVLLLGALIGWGIRELLSLPGRPARERRLERLMTKAASKALEDDWRKRHPGEPLSISVHDEITASATIAVHNITGAGGIPSAEQAGAPKLWLAVHDDSNKSPGPGGQGSR